MKNECLTDELTMKRSTLIIFSLLFLCQFNFGNDFRYLRTNEGLYNGEINSIAQDKSGKMWFATWSGLTNYNGYDFTFFYPELGNHHSLPDKKVRKIFIDSKDILWISSDRGVSYYTKEDQNFHLINLTGIAPGNFYVYGFFESKGNVLIHTNSGIFLIHQPNGSNTDFRTKKLTIYTGNIIFADYINTMYSFNDELALISDAYSTIPHRMLLADLVIDEKDTLINVKNTLPFAKIINALSYVKDENKLFLGTDDGISVLDLAPLKLTDQVFFQGLKILNLFSASNNKLYGYSDDPTLFYLEINSLQTGKFLPDPLKFGSLLDNNITCLFEDFSGNLWVGHQGLGLSILNLNRKAFHSYKRDPANPKSLNGNIVMCFNETGNEIFIGMRQGGINVAAKNPVKDKIPEFQVLTYRQQSKTYSLFNNVWNIARVTDSLFLVASDGGLAKLEKTSNGWIYGRPNEQPLYEGIVRKVLVDKDQNIWCGTFHEGLHFFPALQKNPERKSFHFPYDPANPEGISNQLVLSVLIDSKNRFWVGTNNGLNLLKIPYNQLDLSGKTKPNVSFKQYVTTAPEKDFLNANEINCIYENKDGQLWIATQGGGINIMDPDKNTFTKLTTENGMPGNDVLGILADQSGRKWVSTNKGIVSIDLDNKTKPFTIYSQSDGIQGETFKVNSYYQSPDGEMFFGGDNGFTRFYPNEIKYNSIPPKIGLTNLKIDNKLVNIGDTISRGNIMSKSINELNSIELPYRKNTFSIGVGVHHYQYPEGNMIQYKLEGFNDRWITISASNQNIYFSKVPHGKYTLRINALSADNIEASEERLLEIHILPPWYKTWYMRIIYILLIFSMIGWAFYLLANIQRISFQRKIDAIAFENNENKMKFLTNIAHELRTPMSLVIAPIEDMMQNYTTIEPKWKSHINLMYRNSNYLLTLINQIIDFRKLNAGKLQLNLQTTDIAMLVKDVVTNFKGLEIQKKTNLQVQVPEKSVLVKIDSQKIEEVLYNLLSNAFKHTRENHSILVSLEILPAVSEKKEVEKQRIKITVFNEGKDISDEDKVKIFERFYKVSELVEGAGIGLSFSKSLVEMHQGIIDVESVDGVGVAFNVLLPFDEIEITDISDKSEKYEHWHEDVYNSNQVHELENKGKELTIVIVEDNLDLRTFLKNTLSRNYSCFEAGDGKEGLELVSKIIPDIVISDVIMPKMDGYELCKNIKENTKTCHIPVILLTANSAAEQIVSGYEIGADAYVTKPFDMSIIKAQISRMIRNRELIREKYMTQNFMVEVSTSNISRDDEFIIKLRQLLENNLSETDFNVKKLSNNLNISTTHLYRKLKALTGLSPVEFIRFFKLQKACEMLSNSNLSIKEIGYGLGFNNLSYFVKCFREQFNVTPSVFRLKGLPDSTKNTTTNQSGVA